MTTRDLAALEGADGSAVYSLRTSSDLQSLSHSSTPTRQSTLSSLKHLRPCELRLNKKNIRAFTHTLNSFHQLEELGLFYLNPGSYARYYIDLELDLPMLTSFQIENVFEIEELTLNAPRLQTIKIEHCSKAKTTDYRTECQVHLY